MPKRGSSILGVPEGSSLPAITCASKEPMGVRIGFEVFKVRCLKPEALLVINKELRVPGPHHRFSFDKPNETGSNVSLILLCPQVALEYTPFPKRDGKSILL